MIILKRLYRFRYLILFTTLFLTSSLVTYLVPRILNPVPPNSAKRKEDRAWVASSHYWLDRQACRWLSLCGLQHLRIDPPAGKASLIPPPYRISLELRSLEAEYLEPEESELDDMYDETDPIQFDDGAGDDSSPAARYRNWQDSRQPSLPRPRVPLPAEPRSIPQYVLDHAPLVHLCSQEHFWPSDIATHVKHMKVIADNHKDGMKTVVPPSPLSLDSLSQLNNLSDTNQVFLSSIDDVESRPDWLFHTGGRPADWADDLSANPLTSGNYHDQDPPKSGKPTSSGLSSAPATLLVVDKGNGTVDAFWFFFYSYNLGQTVLNIRFGNHVGDWEHTLIRFQNGTPSAIFFSEHEGGQAFAFDAVEKLNDRPVLYSAVGSHAMYPMPGPQPYILPFSLLKDTTDRGPLWDPARNSRMYWYEYDRPEPANSMANPACLQPAAQNPDAPVDWFFYTGAWGDRLYPLADERQWRLFGQYHYVNGPTGPIWKNLDRVGMCQTTRCIVADSLEPGRTWYG